MESKRRNPEQLLINDDGAVRELPSDILPKEEKAKQP